MTTEKILKSYTVAQLKKEISATNIKGFTKMKRADLHAVIMKNKSRFSHLKEQVKVRKPRKPKPKPKPPKNIPLGPSMKIKEFAVDKRDTEKRHIKKTDVDYFTKKVTDLLNRKGLQSKALNPANKKEHKAYKNFIHAAVNYEARNPKQNVFNFNNVAKEKGLGASALQFAKILAMKSKGSRNLLEGLMDNTKFYFSEISYDPYSGFSTEDLGALYDSDVKPHSTFWDEGNPDTKAYWKKILTPSRLSAHKRMYFYTPLDVIGDMFKGKNVDYRRSWGITAYDN